MELVQNYRNSVVSNQNFTGNQISQQNSYKGTINKLEKSPSKDTVTLNHSNELKEEILGDMDVEVSNGFLGMGQRTIKGKIAGKSVDLKLSTGAFNDNVNLSGTVNGKPVELKLKDYKLSGKLANEDKDLIPYLKMIMADKKTYDNNMAMAAMFI